MYNEKHCDAAASVHIAQGCCDVLHTPLRDVTFCTHCSRDAAASIHIAQECYDALHTSLRDAVMFCTFCLGMLWFSAHTAKGGCNVLHTLLRDAAASTHIAQGCCDVLHTFLRDAVMFCTHSSEMLWCSAYSRRLENQQQLKRGAGNSHRYVTRWILYKWKSSHKLKNRF